MYDPKFSQKQMYDQYGRSRESSKKVDPKPSRSSGFGGMGPDPAEQFGGSPTRGIGAKPPSFGGGQDNNPNRDESENKSTVAKVYEKAVDLFKSFGADEPKDVIVDGKRVYQGPAFRGYDPTTRIGQFGGEYGKQQYLFDAPKLGIEVTRSPVPPTLPPSTINMFGVNTDNPRLNMFGVNRSSARPPEAPELPTSPDVPANMDPLTRGLSQAMLPVPDEPTAPYTIKAGDTLSEIAEMTGTTVEELAEINNIEKVDEIDAGAVIDIPIRRKRAGLGAKPISTEFMDAETKAMIEGATDAGYSMEELRNMLKSFTDKLRGVEPKFDYKDTSTRIVNDLMKDFGLTRVQASAFAGNLASETDGFRSLQEYKPIVKGSAGGYGFAQWTGGRRKAYEKWADEKGLDPSSYEANYGYLKEELSNTQKGTIENIGKNTIKRLKNIDNIEDATVFVQDYYLRPDPKYKHENKRKNYAKEILEMADK